MKVTEENINQIEFKNEWDKSILLGLLNDVRMINYQSNKPEIYIDYQTFHNEYSPERTDPCPDYYGCYTIRLEENDIEVIGLEMTLNELDMIVCTLLNFIEL